MAAPRELRFCWWNVQDFAHFDPNRIGYEGRWPFSADQYHEKRRRVEAAFDVMFGADVPEVIGLCEITRPAAEELRKRRLPDHQLILSEPSKPLVFQVALFVHRNSSLVRRRPLVATDVSAETRPMCAALFEDSAVAILFVACHWPAFDKPSSQEGRRRCADALRRGAYDFLTPRQPSGVRHVVVMGDFNAEPFDDLFETTLYASRDRDHARQPSHHTDDAVSRTRLYNCGWRLLGERTPHGLAASPAREVGTFYQESSRQWRTYDQVLVSGGLLGDSPPRLDEGALLARTDTGNLVEEKPAKFTFESGAGRGLSDHYPLFGRIVLG